MIASNMPHVERDILSDLLTVYPNIDRILMHVYGTSPHVKAWDARGNILVEFYATDADALRENAREYLRIHNAIQRSKGNGHGQG